jgi:CSLREA domain-containing protein
MSRELLRRAFLVIPLALAILAGCADKETTAPLLGTDARLAQGDGGVWTVNSLSDPGVGACDDTECTLREAIAAAASGDQVVFASGLQGAIALATGEMVINKPLSVNGDGRITIDAQTISRVLNVSNGAVTLSGLTLTGGRRIGENGGGILVTAANLTLDGMTRW